MNAYIENKPVRVRVRPYHSRSGLAIIDIDDVLAEFPAIFIDYIEKRTGKPLDFGEGQYGLEDAVVKNYARGHGLLDDFYRSTALLHLPRIKGGLAFIRLIKNLGFHTVALTGRPGGAIPEVIRNTVLWLSNNGFDFDEVCFSRQKGEFVTNNYASDFDSAIKIGVEDNLKNAIELSSRVETVYYRNKPHGLVANHPGIVPFWKFEDAAKHLLERIF